MDRDETRAGQAGEQRTDDETREHGGVKDDEACEHLRRMCLQPSTLASWVKGRLQS